MKTPPPNNLEMKGWPVNKGLLKRIISYQRLGSGWYADRVSADNWFRRHHFFVHGLITAALAVLRVHNSTLAPPISHLSVISIKHT